VVDDETLKRLESIKRYSNAATPGPWESSVGDYDHSKYWYSGGVITEDIGDTICRVDGADRYHNEKYTDTAQTVSDAYFIASIRSDVNFLLQLIEDLL
jgi:hypothetical protein